MTSIGQFCGDQRLIAAVGIVRISLIGNFGIVRIVMRLANNAGSRRGRLDLDHWLPGPRRVPGEARRPFHVPPVQRHPGATGENQSTSRLLLEGDYRAIKLCASKVASAVTRITSATRD